jgi:TonB family protein
MCRSSACTIVGGLSRDKVKKDLELRTGYFTACYQRLAARTDRGTVMLSFAIAPDGSVTDAHGSGMGDVGECVADIVTAIPFPAAPEGTQVTYPVSFRPS